MASGTTTPRVRLVRCPKCRMVLPEVEDVPLYKCGRCETILVVKNRKAIVESTFLLQEIGDADPDKLVHVSEKGESTSSTTQEVHLCQESVSQSGKHDENLSIRRHYNDRRTSGDTDYKCEKLDENGSNESGQLQLESSEHCNVQQQGVSIEGILPTDLHENEELEGVYSESDTNNKIGPNIGGSSFDSPYAAKEINVTFIASPAAGEVLSSDILFSSPNEHLEQPRRSERRGLNHVRSTDSFETADFVTPTSEFSDPDIEHFSKSAATGISHACDGSIPSDGGMDNQFLGQKIHSFENNYRDANYLVPEERQRREKLPAKSLMNGNARNLSSDLSNKPYGTAKYRNWHPDEALEPVMHRCLPKNWTKEVRDEYPSRIPFSQRASLPGYKNAGPSCELHDEFPDYSEQESMKLLRMVSELQDQISKRCNLNGRKFEGRASIDVPWGQKHFPTFNYPEEEIFYPRHDIGKSCLCCHARVWPRSEQLPHPMFPHNQGFCRFHPDHSCYDCHRYCPYSPERHMESGFSRWSHEIISGDQRYGAGKLKRYSREKHYSVRRYRRPMAGGAPFVTCYHCFRPLELPADFLLSERRFQQLRCGACLKVLRFSLQNGNHIVPYEQVGCRTTTNET